MKGKEFYKLLDIIKDHLPSSGKKAWCGSNGPWPKVHGSVWHYNIVPKRTHVISKIEETSSLWFYTLLLKLSSDWCNFRFQIKIDHCLDYCIVTIYDILVYHKYWCPSTCKCKMMIFVIVAWRIDVEYLFVRKNLVMHFVFTKQLCMLDSITYEFHQ